MAIQVKKLITKPSTIDKDILAFIPNMGTVTTVLSVGYIGTTMMIEGEPAIVVVVVYQ